MGKVPEDVKKKVASKKKAVRKKRVAKKAPINRVVRKAPAKKAAVKRRATRKPAAAKAPVKRRATTRKSPIKRTTKGRKNNGANGNYYDVKVAKPLLAKKPYIATCNDIITSLGMTHAEGEAFAAIWREAASRQGNGKARLDAKYNAQKVCFYGDAMLKA